MTEPFKILTVCTGNVCRSPLAQVLLQSGLDSASPGSFVVDSAGSYALADSAMDQRAADESVRRGVDPSVFRARQLSPGIIAGHDLVLGMSISHRGLVVETAPTMLRKTFSLREFARLLGAIEPLGGNPVERWNEAVRKAIRSRRANPAGPEHDDITDPYRQADDVYDRMFDELVPAVESIVTWERDAAQGT